VKLRKLSVISLAALLTITSIVMAAEEEKVVTVGLYADYYSKYIWRGQVLDNKSVFQPAVSASAYGFTGTLWGNMNLKNNDKIVPGNDGEFSEFDWTLDYTNALPGVEGINFSAGVIYYRFPNQVFKPTTEVYGGLTFTKCPVSPSIKIYHDVDEIDGSYVQLSIGHTFEKIYVDSDTCYCGLSLGASTGWGSAGYNHGYFSVDNSKFNDLTLTAGLPFCVGSWTVKPSVNFASMISDEIREATDKSDNIWWGVGLSTSF
jgi:hypothetical protein